jgi:hypothetical protein
MIGTYVKYNNHPYMVVAVCGKQYKLNSPKHGRVKVNINKTEALNIQPAVTVDYQNREFLVTAADTIFSITTGRVVYTDPSDGNRRAILYLAGKLDGYSKPEAS